MWQQRNMAINIAAIKEKIMNDGNLANRFLEEDAKFTGNSTELSAARANI
jgi:hypothetical protein